ncbi:MAG: Gfo/Idh/MocA family oxidoreductase [Acidobacteria bacterium]|nr:Gfo/Idh/MocA family oxidoreductase [Acidobacteriota bacterium]MYD70767.1 Gfo/Idh/MocA family oxidoreductase [Acidobacteriota bacterium]MYJ06333.1 Gfo/Idh/MocA family oxidoreductase [Acidobacteriota bacterium]
MVGGGPGAFIGDVHRRAALLSGGVEFVAGAFSSSPRRSRAKGRELMLDPSRVYDSVEHLIAEEGRLPTGKRVDLVTIVTPNHLHFPVAKALLAAGIHVVCDKPMTFDVAEARRLRRLVAQSGRVFALTHNYTGYPMVKLARDLVRGGRLGPVRKVVVEYPQGWLATPIERSGQKQAAWRTDPKRSGAAGCLGDIGTHAENLAEYVTGLRIAALSADLATFVRGRRLDDDASVLLRFAGGARGVLLASQVSVGEANGLTLRVYGEEGGLRWRQETPETLEVTSLDGPETIWRRGDPNVVAASPAAARATRLPAGHPEAFLEAFATIYANACDTIRARIAGESPDPLALDFPTVEDGLRGMIFVETAVKNAASTEKWTRMLRLPPTRRAAARIRAATGRRGRSS